MATGEAGNFMPTYRPPEHFYVKEGRREDLTRSSDLARVAIVSGFVGVGKDTIVNVLTATNEDMAKMTTATTRFPRIRNGEKDGTDYHFVSKRNFQELSTAGVFFEQSTIFDNNYGVPYSEFTKREHSKCVFACLTPRGAQTFMEAGVPVVRFVIVPGSWEELESRIVKRDSSTASYMLNRLKIEISDYFDPLMRPINQLIISRAIHLEDNGIHFVKSKTGPKGISMLTDCMKQIIFGY